MNSPAPNKKPNGQTFLGWNVENLEEYIAYIKHKDIELWNTYCKEEKEHGSVVGLSHETGAKLIALAHQLYRDRAPPSGPTSLFAMLREYSDFYI